MKKKYLIIFIFFLGFFVGDFESKDIKKKIEKIKIEYFYNKDLEIKKNITNDNKLIKANSFEVTVEKLLSFKLTSDKLPDYVLRTATFQIEKKQFNYNYRIFLQNGLLINEKKIHNISLPDQIVYYYSGEDKDIFHGGLKSVFSYKKKDFGLISVRDSKCDYLSIINLSNGKSLINGDCLPSNGEIDYNGSGGAFYFDNKNLYIAIGTPTKYSFKIDMLAQNEKSIYGKILKISKEELLKSEDESINYTILSKGHRNPQGMTMIDNKLFSTEHGPQGGDEINLIIENGNYEWPLKSYGTRYGDGKSYKSEKIDKNFIRPVYSFIPSIAPSSLAKCPKNLKEFYKENICLMSLSLKEQSLFVILLDKNENVVQSIEKIEIGERLRHFGSNINGEIFFDDDAFFLTTDSLTVLKVEFLNFR